MLIIHLYHISIFGFLINMISISVPGCDRAASRMPDETYFTAESEEGSRKRTSSVLESYPRRKI